MNYQVDYYKILGITKKATKTEIKIAYRKLAMLHHPDRNLDDPDAEIRFKKISEAYSVLSNSFKRTDYDYSYSRYHEQNNSNHYQQQNSKKEEKKNQKKEETSQKEYSNENKQKSTYSYQSSNQDEDYIEPEFYNQPPVFIVTLNFWESVIGCDKNIEIIINKKRYYINHQFPPGVLDHQEYFTIVHDTQICLKVYIEPNKYYLRDNLDVYIHIDIPLSKAILGGNMNLPHWYLNECLLRIPEGTQNGDKLRISNAGIKRDMFIGDLYVIVNVKIPKRLTEKQRAAIENFAKVEDENPTIFQFLKDSWKNFINKK